MKMPWFGLSNDIDEDDDLQDEGESILDELESGGVLGSLKSDPMYPLPAVVNPSSNSSSSSSGSSEELTGMIKGGVGDAVDDEPSLSERLSFRSLQPGDRVKQDESVTKPVLGDIW